MKNSLGCMERHFFFFFWIKFFNITINCVNDKLSNTWWLNNKI